MRKERRKRRERVGGWGGGREEGGRRKVGRRERGERSTKARKEGRGGGGRLKITSPFSSHANGCATLQDANHRGKGTKRHET